jgi:hypothetical protein
MRYTSYQLFQVLIELVLLFGFSNISVQAQGCAFCPSSLDTYCSTLSYDKCGAPYFPSPAFQDCCNRSGDAACSSQCRIENGTCIARCVD